MNVNREQTLFLIVLVLVGLGGYSNFTGAYESEHVSRGTSFDPAPLPDAPVIKRTGDGAPHAPYVSDGRDVFMPPRDWVPLAPLSLDPPPLPEIGAVGLVPLPGVQLEYATLFRRPPPPSPAELAARAARDRASESDGAPATDGEDGADLEDSEALDSTDSQDSRFAGIDFSEQESGEVVADEGTLERSYDWIRRKNRPRVFGNIMNPDRFALLDDPGLPVRFQLINVATGKVQGEATFERSVLEGEGVFRQGFGLADTVRTRAVLLRREVHPSVANIKSQIEAARTCLTWLEDDEQAALEGAEEFLRQVLSFDASEAEAWELLGEVKRLGFDTEGELEIYDQARAQGVHSARLDAKRAMVFHRLGLLELAESTLREAVKAGPNEFMALMALGDVLKDRERAGEAVPLFERAASVAPDANLRLKARLEMIRGLIRTAQFDSAAGQIDRVLRMGIESADAHVLKGVLDLAASEPARAMTSFHTALAIDPRHHEAVFNLGVALALSAESDPRLAAQARDRFDQAQNLDPLRSFDCALSRGALEESLGNREQAAARFDEALLFDPANPFGLYRAGRMERRAGNLERAEEQLRRALEEDGRIADVLIELAFTALLLDEPEQAEQYLRELLRSEPNNGSARILLGSALLRQNRVSEAADEYERAVGDPAEPNPAALCGVGWCAYREGRVERALESLANARAVSKLEGDVFHIYADQNQAAIDDHRNKEQWVDRFDRKQIKNNWNILEPFGPEIRLTDKGSVSLSGMQRPTNEDEPTELNREIQGDTFVSFEARLLPSSRNEAVAGIRLAYEKPRGRGQGTQEYGALSVARFPDGSVRIRALTDYETIIRDWTVVDGLAAPAGQPIRLAIERTDYDKGLFRVLVDDRVVADEIEIRSLKKLRHMAVGGVFARAGGRQNVDVECDLVRVVRYSFE